MKEVGLVADQYSLWLPKFPVGFVCSLGGSGVAFLDLLFKEIDGFEPFH
jgi:hypothetical protein